MCPGDETVGAYVAGGLAGATRSDFERHLDTCASCQELVASLARANAPTGGGRGGEPTTEVIGDAPTTDARGGAHAGEARARKTLGRYVIDRVLGAGGMGVVYRAHDPELGRPIALKVVRPHDGHDQTHAQARLVREARAMAKIAHPNVIVVHDAGTVDDEVFIAMELVDGENLADWQRAKPRSWREVVEVYLQAGRGLAAAHRAGLVHRDFKPHNTLVATEGRVRVLDFGLARSVDDGAPQRPSAPTGVSAPLTSSAEATLTRTGAVMGSPQFMSPEQHSGLRADARSDQFSYCVALYHALYGAYPYSGATYEALALSVTEGEAAPAPRATKVPSAIGKILARGMRRLPDERYPSMDDVVIALTSAVRGRRPFWVAGLALAAIAGLGVAIAVVATRSDTTAPAPIAMGFAKHQQAITSTGAYVGMPDLSPDGHQLAYATATTVALRDLTTGATRELPGFDGISGIRWAPAGDRLVVSTGRGPMVMSADGTAPRLFPMFTTSCTGAWSPDGTEILWGCDGDAGFKILTIATGATRPLMSLPPSQNLHDFDWSSSGIVIATQTDGKLDSNSLWLVRADGTNLTKLVEEAATAGTIRWNARADRMYYTRVANPGFELVYREQRDPTRAPVTALVQPLAEFWSGGGFALSRDERRIIYPQRRTYLDVVLHESGKPTPRELTADRIPKQALSVSPDGRSIVYAAGSLEQMSLYRQRLDGSAPEKLAAPERFYIQSAVSPDSASVAATSLVKGAFHTSIVPASGPSRDVEHPATNLFWPLEWTRQNQIVLLAASRFNYVVIDPATDTARLLWPSDVEQPLFNTALAPDGQHIAANLPAAPAGSALAVLSIADRSVRILSPVSAQTPVGWSADGRWIYVVEEGSEAPRRRVVAVSAAGDGTSRLVAVTGRGSEPVVLPDESGVVHVAKNTLTDLWLASLDAIPQVPPGPPAAPPPPVTPPAFHPAPQNLALGGTPRTAPEGWVVDGTPRAPVVTSSCGRPGTCVLLDGGGSISQYVDATRYRGHRVRIEFDARVEKATLVVGANSGVFARTEFAAGRTAVTEAGWTRYAVTADIAPDAIYVKLKAMLTEGGGRAWIANLSITP